MPTLFFLRKSKLRLFLKYRWRRLCGLAAVALLLAVVAVYLLLLRRETGRALNQTVQLPLSAPSATAWTADVAFPHLTFFEPTCLVAAQDGSRRLFVLERRGTIQMIDDSPQASEKWLVLDIFDRVLRTPEDDDGALGMVLHPEFGKPHSPHRGDLFVFYTASVNGRRYDRLSRFTIADGGHAADPDSEVVLIDQLDRNLWHNGGALAFGPDGFLYVGVGDEGEDADLYENGQRIDKNLFSGILRIDVDRIGGGVSHPPPRQPRDGSTAHYYIPNDNPFVGRDGALEEFWAIGLRNPHRIAFDQQTGLLWAGEVGHQLREEINLIQRGGNYGWSYAEGRLQFEHSYLKGQRPRPYVGHEIEPLHDYPHHHGNNCVIGGFVYRGSRFPELRGKYIYGDNGSGRVWAMEFDANHNPTRERGIPKPTRERGIPKPTRERGKRVSNVELLNLPFSSKSGLSSFALDSQGELLMLVLGENGREDGRIYRLARAPEGFSGSLPRWLSETGVFEDLATLSPSAGVYPYEVNAPLWSDGALKRRWILLPGDGGDPDPATDRIGYSATGAWDFPAGTVFIKHFELPLDERDPTKTRRLETRLLVRDSDGGAYGLTYKWNEDESDAELLSDGLDKAYDITTADGRQREQVWHYPSRQTCLVCHTKQAGYVLGVNARQLLGHGDTDQLRTWSDLGMFRHAPSVQQLEETSRLVSIHDTSAPLEHRVRSYLDANCAHCHRPGGVRGRFDARFDTPLDKQGVIAGLLNTHEGLPGAYVVRPGDPSRSMLVRRMLDGVKPMPTVGVNRRDLDAVAVFCRWIDSLPKREGLEQVEIRDKAIVSEVK